MDSQISLIATGAEDVIAAELGGTDEDIPLLHIGHVQVTFYDFRMTEAEMSAWLRRLASEATSLAEKVDEMAARKNQAVAP